MTERNHIDTLSNIRVGAVSTWRAAGLSRKDLASLVRAGELVKIRYGVYARASLAAQAEADPCVAHALQVAAVTDRTRKEVASHHSAAMMFGLSLLSKPPAGTVTLTVPPGARTGRYGRGDVIRHAARLPAEHVTALFGLPVTTAARTVADIARAATFMEGVVVADSALYERHTSKTELRRVLAACDRWPGIAQAREVAEFGNSATESPLESCARVFFRDHGLPPPEQQVNIVGQSGRFIARADFLWRRFWTIAEADGLMKYSAREDAIAQLKRDRLLREAGYEVVHFTWHELFADPAAIVSRIRESFTRAIRLGRAPGMT